MKKTDTIKAIITEAEQAAAEWQKKDSDFARHMARVQQDRAKRFKKMLTEKRYQK